MGTDQSLGLEVVEEFGQLGRGQVRVDRTVESTQFAYLSEGLHQIVV